MVGVDLDHEGDATAVLRHPEVGEAAVRHPIVEPRSREEGDANHLLHLLTNQTRRLTNKLTMTCGWQSRGWMRFWSDLKT